MSHDRLADVLERGEAAIGARAMTVHPTVVEVIGGLGFDFAWLDLEHAGPSPYDSRALEGLTRAGDAAGVDPLVRLPSGDPPLVHKVLDAGFRSLLVPQVQDASEVRRAVAATRFTYDGEPGNRGVGAGRATRWGETGTGDTDRRDDEVTVGCMIETREAVENVQSILSVPGLDFVFVGPSDLSVAYGRPMTRTHPDVTAAIERVRDAALDADVPVGWVTDDTGDAAERLQEGYRLLRVGDEVSAVRSVLGDRLDALRET